jgi:outer membrane murein-binding lipoprotein Lpp
VKHFKNIIILLAFAFSISCTIIAIDSYYKVNQLQTQVTELRQQMDTMQSDINFLRIENGVLWRKCQEWGLRP